MLGYETHFYDPSRFRLLQFLGVEVVTVGLAAGLLVWVQSGIPSDQMLSTLRACYENPGTIYVASAINLAEQRIVPDETSINRYAAIRCGQLLLDAQQSGISVSFSRTGSSALRR